MVFERFDDVNYMPLRIFNRVVFLHNLISDSGKTSGSQYINLFNEVEKKQMLLMSAYIKKVGEAQARRDVTKNLVIVDDPV